MYSIIIYEKKYQEISTQFFWPQKIASHFCHCLESWPPPKSFIHLSFERDWFWCSWDATRFQKLRCLPKHNWRLKHKDMRRHSFHSKGSVWSRGCIQSMFLLQISISLWHTDKHFHMSSLTKISFANYTLSYSQKLLRML